MPQADCYAEPETLESYQRIVAAEQVLRTITQGVNPQTGAGFFRALVLALSSALGVGFAFLAETTAGGTTARTLAFAADGAIRADFDYSLDGTPCGALVGAPEGETTYCVAAGVRALFPGDQILHDHAIDSYLAVQLECPESGSMAWLGIMDRGPIADRDLALSILQLFASRAAAEVDRLALETRLRQSLRLADEKFVKAFRSSPQWVAITGLSDGRFLEVSESFLRRFGYTRDEVLGRTAYELRIWVNPEDRDRLVWRIETEGAVRSFDFDYRVKNGAIRTARLSADLIEVQGVTCLLAVVHDITDDLRAAEALRVSEERYALAARGANDGLWDWCRRTHTVYFSPRWKAMLGYDETEIGSSPDEWMSRVHPVDLPQLEQELSAHLDGRTEHFQNEHRLHHRDRSWRWMLVRGLAVRDERGRATRIAGSLTDITSRKHAEEQLLHDVFHDALTGLPNRALFLDRLDHALERAERHDGSAVAVLLLDLDRFKVVNDSLGHETGDRLLVAIARALHRCLRPEDTVARLGGDEFTILLEDVPDVAEATRIAERVQHELAQPIAVGSLQVFTSASIGIAVTGVGLSPDGVERPEDLLREADTAMYRAKSSGRARSEVFDPRGS